MALIALYQENSKDTLEDENNPDLDEQEAYLQGNMNEDDVNESSPIEKVIQLVERMANAEGVHRKVK